MSERRAAAPDSPGLEADVLREADEAARRLAVNEFVLPVALEAGAGTGKTRALVSRLATWLLGPGWTESERDLVAAPGASGRAVEPFDVAARVAEGTVAITFTEAAAAEMARRLSVLLLDVAAGRPARDLAPLPALLEGTGLAPRARALAVSLSRLRIQTIHGFCHALLAEHPFEAGLHPSIEIDADGERVAAAAREALVARLRARDEKLLALIVSGRDPLEIHEAVVALASSGARRTDLAVPRFTAAECDTLLADLDGALRRFLDFLEPLVAAAKRLKRAGKVASALQQLVAVAVARQPEPAARFARLREELPDLATEWSSAFAEWRRGALTDTEKLHLGAASDAYLAAAREAREQIEFVERADPDEFETARRALAPLLDETRARLRRSGTLTFDDLLDEAIALLDGNGALRRRVRRSIRQLLVDEFQDTDRRQCELLRQLVLRDTAADTAPGERPGLFVVGDPKQSIFAWRSADLAAYQAFVDELVAAGGVRGRLAINFRSAPPILDEVERSVAPSMRFAERLQPAFERLLPSAPNAASPGFARHERGPVEFWLSWDAEAVAAGEPPLAVRAAEIEAAAIAADIADLAFRHGEAWKEFALLLRTRGHLEIYLEALRRAGVPYVVQNDRSYYRRREVIDVLSLVRFALDPGDDLARVAALRSPFVGVPDAAWLPLETAGFPAAMRDLDGFEPKSLEAARAAVARAAAAMPPDAAAIPGLAELADWPAALLAAVDAIARLRAEWRVLPVAAWLERLRSRFLIEPVAAARFLGRFGLANVERLFAELEEALAEAADPLAVLSNMRRAVEEDVDAEEARPPESEIDAVSVLTIHTAKGLEFGHVYVAQAHKQPRSRADDVAAALLRPARGDEETPAELELFGAPSPGWRRASAEAERARDAEIVRLLYVALTRAKQRLVVCGAWDRADGKRAPVRSFLALLEARRPGDLEGLFAPGDLPRLADQAVWRRLDRFAAAPARPEAAPVQAAAAVAIDAEARRNAVARQARSRFASASTTAGLTAGESLDELAAALAETPDHRRFAQAADAAGLGRARGIALHRALELAHTGANVEAAASAAFLAARPGAAAAELQALAGDVRKLRTSALWRKVEALAPAVLERELPLVVAAEAGSRSGPLDGYLGTLDLLYRDPESGETVVADFKSDPLDGEIEAAVAGKIGRYRPQLELYGRAVERALALQKPPRLELWLLGADRIAVIPAAAAR